MALFNPCMKIKIILNSTFIFKDFGFGSHKLKIEFTKHPKESWKMEPKELTEFTCELWKMSVLEPQINN
jgi:hypothetical protein